MTGFTKRTDGKRFAANEKICANCVFFTPMTEVSHRDKWSGVCKRFPTHEGVNHSHSCGEFTDPTMRPWITTRDLTYENARALRHKEGVCPYAGGPMSNACECDSRTLRDRAVRKTQKTSIGNFLLELTPVEAVVVEAALRLAIEHGFVFEESEGASLLSRVSDRLPPTAKL